MIDQPSAQPSVQAHPDRDPYFIVRTVSATPEPQTTCWAAMHQDYCEDFVAHFPENFPDEHQAGRICVKQLLKAERGHYGPFEHAQIVLNVGWFPHSVMQQARTHRIGVSFDVQSMRYTGKRIVDAAIGARELEEVFYLRPAGRYTDRFGSKYVYDTDRRNADLLRCREAAKAYCDAIASGISEEHARGMLPFDYRQHFVVSFSMRALMHFLDLRSKKDAQLEIIQLCEHMMPHFEAWAPEIAAWYKEHRYGKARLSP